ncbi:F-box/LRR-repeat protein At4g14103-like [Papaver somniferum]|uniref:F-box/LRR-repeat protein At4g14103-like n=1 Tax=Papaver somniferum TaxID=3469 RepID=UPI000E700B47|nr:F-box/LRR-repeat protein At4g14103-like [Papaver somniferum]
MEDVGEDMISKLPESIIHHVLSLLPIKCAVSTTVLSKTWKNQWVCVPVFDFRQWRSITHSPGTVVNVETSNANVLIRQKDTDKFMDFLDSTFFSNNNMSTIQKFYLCCDIFFDAIRVREWITGLIKRKVEELMLTVNFPKANPVPSDLLTCESPTALDIDFVKQHVLEFPQAVSLPRLKKLRLSYVLFKDRAATQK